MLRCVSVSLDIGISVALVRRRSPPPPQPRLGHSAGGARSRGTLLPGTVTLPLCSRTNASPFWIMFLLVWGRLGARSDLRGGLPYFIAGSIVAGMRLSRAQDQTADLFWMAGVLSDFTDEAKRWTPGRGGRLSLR
jgi:hypothetical protein